MITYRFSNPLQGAVAINDVGQIVGNAGSSGFLYSGGVQSTFSYPGALATSPTAINDAGLIAGTYVTQGVHGFYDFRSFTYQNGTFSSYGGSGTQITGINDNGVIVGYERTPSGPVGFGGNFRESSASPTAVNDQNQIVGTYNWGNNSFLYDRDDDSWLEITFPGWSRISAQDINDSGQIIGNGTDSTGTYRGFVYDTSTGAFSAFDASQVVAINDTGRILAYQSSSSHAPAQGTQIVRNFDDFNRDATSDIVLQGGGTVAEWFMQNGRYSAGSVVAGNLPPGWAVVGTGDFNGDGLSDLLLQGGSTIVEWFLNGSGQYASGNVVTTNLQAGWSVVGTGDVNGDGITDVVLQGGGTVVDWVLNASGGYQAGNVLSTGLPAGWQVMGVGDLNGDGIADVVLQNGATVVDWILNASGGYARGNVVSANVPAGWTVRALGDFDGNGRNDLVLQGGDTVVNWLISNGAYAGGHVVATAMPAGWNVMGTGDFNNDGTADISVQGGGTVVSWLMQNGQYAGGHLVGNVPDGWGIVAKT